MSNSSARTLFGSAAGFNVLAGLPFLVALQPVAALMGLQVTPTSALFIQITMALVVMFGWAYWMISRDPVRYRPYIVLGILLKILVVAVIYGHWLAGNIPWPLPVLASGDIIFALLFWRYLSSTR
ncbi:hypothetical protein JFU37_29485 [Pseudomonas sp. TH41]|uniref:hypothetical protein n=1 Tax=Pseudomonas sp. TH41 TaxID=2796405 RepID=UPI001913A4BC|nr:hypothetical protein [Pseudomonas sp. TH41]MBK5356586.1 hypothetical protein [Pseudomonas sp. TH41]